jgi:hypothetical protein
LWSHFWSQLPQTWLAQRAERIPDTDWAAVRAGAAELLAGPGT